MNKQTVT